MRCNCRFSCLLITMLFLLGIMCGQGKAVEGGGMDFDINGFDLVGNTIFSDQKLEELISSYIGTGKSAVDVEKARDVLEGVYHRAGYPAVLVNIPEQLLEGGIVRLEVIEARIGRVTVTGNRYFSAEWILQELLSLMSGKILYRPGLEREIARLRRNPDFDITPSMSAGQEPGTIDVELRVKDKIPLHGYLEVNNRASNDTTQLRANAMIHYDNLWQKEHSLSFQYQTSPQKTSEVKLFNLSYVLPSPWNADRQMVLYYVSSDSDVAFGQGLKVTGGGMVSGFRYAIPLPEYRLYAHNVTLGFDYKDFNQAVGFTLAKDGTTETTQTPITYLPFSLSYSSGLPDSLGGTTQFTAGLNFSLRGLVSKESEFNLKRFKAKSNYLFATAGIQRTQKLPLGMTLTLSADGQIADGPIIDNEQYTAGGMESVRGYMESEASGDDAVHGMVEISFPDPIEAFGLGRWLQTYPFAFYDFAELTTKNPLPGEDPGTTLEGFGFGIRGWIGRSLEYYLHWARTMNATDNTNSGDHQVSFKMKASF